MITTLLKSPALQRIAALLEKEPSLLMEELWDAPKAALIALALHVTGRHVLVIAGGQESRLLDDLSYFGLGNALEFPSWETLPGEEIAPSPDIVGRRFDILDTLLQKPGPHLVVAPLQACLQKLLPPRTLGSLCRRWKVGDSLPFRTLPELLEQLGYRRSTVAADKGEYAMRGGILDLFPLSSTDPFRLDFFGDVIERIRIYDPIGQTSTGRTDSLLLTPASELAPLREEKEPASLLDYLGTHTLLIFDDLLALEDKYVALRALPRARSSLLPMEALFAPPLHRLFWARHRAEELSEVRLEKRVGRAFYSGAPQGIRFHMLDQEIATKRICHPFVEIAPFFTPSENQASEILPFLSRFAQSNLELRFITASEPEEKALKEQLASIPLPPAASFERGYLSAGLVVEDMQFALLPMTEITRRYKTRRQKWRTTYHTPASEFHELAPGDIVVHFHHGVGKFLGMEKRPNHLGSESEFLLIEYAEGSTLYAPITQAHLVSRYIGAHEEIPALSALGTQKWQHTKARAQQAIIGYARDLLSLSAERTVQGGFLFPPDSADMLSFEEEFPFTETEDQLQAIASVKRDMCSAKAMDRLICGDVGYGKTEVAMRAAFKAVVDGGKQVAVLVPTTVLAMQHHETFCARMAHFPVRVAVLSRFCTQREIRETLQRLAKGSVDVVIGTHRMISKDVAFKDLGLLIIDEEQRFGVRAKEHLKALKTGVDCLTLSATPIPRTLYLSLMGAREISVINTPPQDRLPIKSILSERQAEIIQAALMRELSRDGQAYVIHNRVETIFLVAEELQKLLPEARIVVGHGQMPPDEIDAVFHAFKSGHADILVATTIVENGIDIPNANTILIDRADQFGMADLYQLRGRVGRWNRPAYAYFLVPSLRSLPEISRKRLHALIESSGYGGGMKIALRDLEIRGAGDILGVQQSGQISTIGFHLYCKLLKRAIDALRKQIPASFTETKMEFSFNARLPDNYIPEVALRLEFYHRFGEAASAADLDALLEELQDRFGPYPEEVLWLYHLTRVRLFASQKQISLLKFDRHTLTVEQQQGKQTTKKTISFLPSKNPAALEQQVIDLLTIK
jgi:transcription-repair coupling factor (superfamily II helicase)